ncbi:MAG: hypothetical protein HOQ45_02400 [Nocardioidaceae bacterium]|nr:hypothetical protein [Dermatophilaceae bacterium]NUR05845.1 hypothetical protein [Nocardioidaceae bacterium]NUR80037.1 hypothetical protein [Dermatophilaceae bacterium]
MTETQARPSLQRKHTRSTETKRTEALDEGLRITIGEDVYEVRVGDLNALHERALRRQYGSPFADLMEEFETKPGLDSVAAVVWLARFMAGETDLTYEQVAVDVDLEFAEAMALDSADPAEGDSPEA